MPTTATTTFCKDLPSCFQAIYNLLFALLIALAFLYFLYGAFLYLLSAGGVYSQEEAKRRMINSIVALLIALGMPMILYMINPEMFKVTLQVPEVTTTSVERMISLDEVEIAEQDLDTDSPEVQQRMASPTGPTVTLSEAEKSQCLSSLSIERDIFLSALAQTRYPRISSKCDCRNIFKDSPLKNIKFRNNDNGTEYINPKLKNIIIALDRELQKAGIKIIITDGLSPCVEPYSNNKCPPGKKLDRSINKCCDHKSKCHRIYGTFIDVVVLGKPPTDPSWNTVINIARSVGFHVLDERRIRGSQFSSGAHLHLVVK
jgi:hypothetical protein